MSRRKYLCLIGQSAYDSAACCILTAADTFDSKYMNNLRKTSQSHKSMLITIEDFQIEISFPEDLYGSFLKKIHLAASDQLSFEHMDKLLQLMILAFREGKISIDELAAMSNSMFSKINKPNDTEWLSEKNSRIRDYLEMTANLSYRIRFPDETLPGYLKTILSYPDITVTEVSEEKSP